MWEGDKSPILGLGCKRRVHIVVVDNLHYYLMVIASQRKMFVVNISDDCHSFLYWCNCTVCVRSKRNSSVKIEKWAKGGMRKIKMEI